MMGNRISTKKSRAIIIGGAGFIASHLADELLKNDYDLSLFYKPSLSVRNISHIEGNAGIIHGDFTQTDDIRGALTDVDYVFHMATTTLPGNSNLNPVYDVESNLLGTLNLLNECVNAGIKKIIFISSGGAVYGKVDRLPISEEQPLNPTSSYGICKVAIEKYIQLFHQLHGLNYSILRVSNPYGERHNPLRGHGIIGVWLHRILKKETIEIWGNGMAIRDFVHVKDVAKALRLAAESDLDSTVLNVGSGQGHSLLEISSIIGNVIGRKVTPKLLDSRSFDVPENVLDISKIRNSLDWQPEIELQGGIAMTWEWMRSEGPEFMPEAFS